MTAATTITVPICHFHAGPLRLGIVAAAIERVVPVAEIGDAAASCPHIGALLRLPISDAVADRRMVVVSGAGRQAQLLVDGPIRLSRIGARDLLPMAMGLRFPSLVGFASEGDQLVLLLHAGWLIEKARRS